MTGNNKEHQWEFITLAAAAMLMVTMGARREGDPPSLVAASEKLRRTLSWAPQYTDLRTIVEHAWKFAVEQSSRSAREV